MTVVEGTRADERFLASGEEAGTAPTDRRFRPDVEGLRAVAVLLVVLYHAGIPHLTGGFVGVDVFFVISGFVITGLLLRERSREGATSVLGFYARRCRRILPAATLVIFATVAAAFVALGVANGIVAANDGRWTAVFLANFHFEQVGTNYFTASLPPSPLQNYWSLSVEEQFYVVYPTLFLVLARLKHRVSLEVRLAVALVVVIVASYALSIVQTSTSPAAAYFSPLTRAWELALGALVAVGTSWLKSIPSRISAVVTWAGLAAILVAAFTFNAQKIGYPGSLVAIPVVGAGMVIAGGVSMPRSGAEALLGLTPVQWLGRRSFSWYLWHWPILTIAAENLRVSTLPLDENLVLVAAALLLASVTYSVVENPIRHWKLPARKSVVGGVVLIVVTVSLLSLIIASQSTSTRVYSVNPAQDSASVVSKVAAAATISVVPKSVAPPLSKASSDWGGSLEVHQCSPGSAASSAPICTLGDLHGKKLLVVYGDSHALQWIPAFDFIAKKAHWRLVVLGKPGCPAGFVTVINPAGTGRTNGSYEACNAWHKWAVNWINTHAPSVLVATQRSDHLAPTPNDGTPKPFTSTQWQNGLKTMLDAVKVPGIAKFVLGNTPQVSLTPNRCLTANANNVQACTIPASKAVTGSFDAAEASAAQASGATYVNATPWFCTTVCTMIIDRYAVYLDDVHITATYSRYLEVVLGKALGFSST